MTQTHENGSTSLEVVDGLFTGHIQGTHYYGEEKADLVSRLAAELGAPGNLFHHLSRHNP